MELRLLGLNILTFSFVGTIVFTCLQFWGLVKQNGKIRRNRSGASVSVAMFAFAVSGFFSAFLMGIPKGSIALLFNGLVLSSMNVVVLVGLYKFKGFTTSEKLVMVGLSFIALFNAVLPYKEWFYFVLGMSQMISIGLQPIEIIRRKSSGVVEIRLLLCAYLSNCFWTVYSFIIGNWPLEIIGIVAAVILTITIVVWWMYRIEKN